MKKIPFISLVQSLFILRISVALIFILHATVRIYNDTIGRFGEFLNTKGLVFGQAMVWGITVFEIVGGIALAIGYLTKWLAAGFIILLVVGIVLIHASFGWFVGEHGSGGVEYSFILIIALIVIAADDRK